MFPAHLWYAAAFAADVLPSQPFPAQVAGEAVVLYRRSDGGMVALADRCCHRAAPLSLGRVEGDALRCLYHGLKFDPQGAKADRAALPRTALEREGWHHRQGFLDYDANFHLINDNLTDFSHVAYVHAATFGRGADGCAHELPKVTQLDNGVLGQRWVTDTEPLPMDKRLLGIRIDQRMIEAQQRTIDARPDPAFVSTLHDSGLIRFRRLLDAKLPREHHAA